MQETDNLKYTGFGLAAGGLLLAIFTSGAIAIIALGVGTLVVAYLLYKEGLGGSGAGTRRASLAIQVALVILAFAWPYRMLVKPAQVDADSQRRGAQNAESDLENDRAGLAELEESAGVTVSDVGLQREERRNLALRQDIESLRQRVEFRPSQPAAEPEPGSDLLLLLTNRVDERREKLDAKRQRLSRERVTQIDLSKVPRLGFGEANVEKSARQALSEVEIAYELVDRAIDSGIRKVEKIDPEILEPAAHDVTPKIDVATRGVLVEVRADLEAISRFLHQLQNREPYLGVRLVQLPANLVKSGVRLKKDQDPEIQGDLITAKIQVEAYYENAGVLLSEYQTPTGDEPGAEGTDTPKRRFF